MKVETSDWSTNTSSSIVFPVTSSSFIFQTYFGAGLAFFTTHLMSYISPVKKVMICMLLQNEGFYKLIGFLQQSLKMSLFSCN